MYLLALSISIGSAQAMQKGLITSGGEAGIRRSPSAEVISVFVATGSMSPSSVRRMTCNGGCLRSSAERPTSPTVTCIRNPRSYWEDFPGVGYIPYY